MWDPTAHALFDRLKIRRGWKILEIGPGQGSLHLELRRRAHGPVDAVEPSTTFTRRLGALCARDGLGEGRSWQSTLVETPLPRQHYDLIFARWVFLFLPNPQAHVKKLASALKPGGVLAIEDYQRETLRMIPVPKEWAGFLAADAAFFASQGGNASIAGELPTLFERAGLKVSDTRATVKTGHPGSPVWRWLSSYFLPVMDQLGDIEPFTPVAARNLRRHWLVASRSPTSLLIGPTLVDVVGRKRAGSSS